MLQITLPDGSSRDIQPGASAWDVAQDIGPGLAQAAVAARVNGIVQDLRRPIHEACEVAILTKSDPESLTILRHSSAHLMADAILRLFPKAQLTIGPVIEDGFYYDIYLPDEKLTPEDFPKVESEMKRIAKTKTPFERHEVGEPSGDEYFERYQAIDGGQNKFKNEIVDELLAKNESLSFYKHGDFVDLCRGPHVPHTGFLKHVKLTQVSGSYWRADAQREQLVRVYGTAFFTKDALKEHLHLLEEAKKRDHRVLGERLDLFSMSEEAPGFPFFHPRGTVLFNQLTDYMRGLLARRGYQEVKTPLILSEKLWHTSGHYDNYMENMFFTKLKLRAPGTSGTPGTPGTPGTIKDNVEEDRPMAVKPMNCPGHLIVYRTRPHSHNEFPLRFAEMGLVHRRELSGVRHGLFRVQAFTQDDAHHFCTPAQIQAEVIMLIEFFREVYHAFDLEDVRIELSTRPDKSIGTDAMWNEAESALTKALDKGGIDYQLNAGDGAFYGPKIDFHIRDVLKRSWQCGTIQLDFSMPERFGLSYIGADGKKHTPVMLHRACYGSLERFMGIIIENYAGKFPLWLAPEQVWVLPVSAKYVEYAKHVTEQLVDRGLRASARLKDDRIGYKIRQASLMAIPYVIVVGEKESTASTVNIRSRDAGELGEMSLDDFFTRIDTERKPRSLKCQDSAKAA
jgi:threonyl-tRNA synthetase